MAPSVPQLEPDLGQGVPLEAKTSQLARVIMRPTQASSPRLVAVQSRDPGKKKERKKEIEKVEIFAQGKADLT